MLRSRVRVAASHRVIFSADAWIETLREATENYLGFPQDGVKPAGPLLVQVQRFDT